MHDTTFEQITENLKRALDIVENCGEAYKNASDTIKKLMNQAIFEKFYISNDADMEFKVDAEFKPPFDQILEPVKDDIIRINRLAQDCSSKLSYYIDIAKDHIQKIFGCGLYTINNSTNMSTYSNGSNFFSHNSSSKVLLVEIPRICQLTRTAQIFLAIIVRVRYFWWSWRESNPRPKTHPMYFYYHSPFFFIPSAARKRTSLQVQ